MKEPFGGILLHIAFRLLVPFSLVYAIYVLILGETSPGGGFQAGVVLAFGIVLARLILGEDTPVFNIKLKNSLALAGIGTFIYALAGWLTLFGGGKFLDYGFLPFAIEETHELHALGILIIEIGVTVCVMMTILNIMDVVTKRSDD
ncbi:MAG: MnhB domain-containing protein [Negativicutes bacterium]|jgi:Na+/H+ antiporter mnhB subunit-related protein